jgi:hypothetical protein
VIALSLNSVYFNLDEVIFFLKNGDFSFFNFHSDYSDNDAVVYMKGTGCLYICNVSDNVIPEETVRLVIEVLEHLNECLEQAYDKLVLWDWKHHKWGSGKECFTHDPQKAFELEDIIFGLNDWPKGEFQEYFPVPKPKAAADCFWMNFRCDPLEFPVQFLCQDRRLCSIKPYIL